MRFAAIWHGRAATTVPAGQTGPAVCVSWELALRTKMVPGPEEGARGETTAEEAARQEQERQAAKLNGSG